MTCRLCGFHTTNATVPICKEALCGICKAVADIDEEINQATTLVRRLLAKRSNLRSEQNRVHDLMNRLPVELRNYTFELALCTRDEWGGVIEESGRQKQGIMPSYLTSICKGWRDIACSNPSLWSTIHIALGGQTSRSLQSSPIAFLRDWISRSQTLPLSFHIVVYPETDSEELKDLANAISECTSTWHSLSLRIPFRFLRTFHHNNFQYDRLRRLRVISDADVGQSVPFFNPRLSPETIEIDGLPLQMVQISWNHLTSATVVDFYPEEITLLFQYASQMTHCRIVDMIFFHKNSVMHPITHQKLEKLFLGRQEEDMGLVILGSLTLPCLKEFHTDQPLFLTPAYLPALVRRSSCPLTTIVLLDFGEDLGFFHALKPLPGVTDLVLDPRNSGEEGANHIQELLLELYFPDLQHLTIERESFLFLWRKGHLPYLIDLNRSQHHAHDKGTFRKILVQDRSQSDTVDGMGLKSEIGEELKAMQLDIIVRENAVEILL